MNKHEIALEAVTLSFMLTSELEKELRSKLNSLGIIINIKKLEIKDKGNVFSRKQMI